MAKLCLWCGKPLPLHMSQRKRHPECARLHQLSQNAITYAEAHGGVTGTCQKCGKPFRTTRKYRAICPICAHKPVF